MKIKIILLIVIVFGSFRSNVSNAQEKPAANVQKLALALANPVANLISVPFQNNTVWGIGENNGSQNVLNIQPVIPIGITKGINMINRVIVPVISQFNVTGMGSSQNALADIQYSIFFSPKKSKVIWGVGPIMSIPTATNTYLGSGRFSIGPTGVLLYQTNGWTMGALVNQFWSVGGNPDRGNQTQAYLQPFLGYSWKTGGGFTLNAEMTQNWKIKRTQTYMNLVFSGL
ncbi:MAG TPA: hypothetical protein PKD83_06475, partial [Ignavibacteria bacterium]|nr:hypothetical protein [Ignavibacteria bacterium]